MRKKQSGYIGETTTGELNENVKLASLSVKGKIKVAAPEAGAVTDNRPKITQTINRDANTKWVVLGIENTDKDINETNETLLITTKNQQQEQLNYMGQQGIIIV